VIREEMEGTRGRMMRGEKKKGLIWKEGEVMCGNPFMRT
jgi:hypothetical protein